MQYRCRITLYDIRTGLPIDTRLVNGPDRAWIEQRCEAVRAHVAKTKDIPVDLLRGRIDPEPRPEPAPAHMRAGTLTF